MAFNLLQLAKFINGERPSADKFNSIFQFIESRLRGIDISIGQNITDGSNDVTIIDSETSETTSFKVAKKGFKQKNDNEYVLGARDRNLDVSSLMSFIGSASNLNPLMLNELQTIKEIIPAGVTEYNTKYPVSIANFIISLVNLNSSSFTRWRSNNSSLDQDGDFYLGYRNSFVINGAYYTTEITWYKPTETALELEYVFNPETISNSMLSYQGASYNTIPDFNTPKNASSVFVGNEEYFYNLKFSERDSEGYVTITLPYAKYVSLNVDNQETSELNSGNPTFHNQIKLPEIFKEIQLESGVSQFLIPKGLLYLVHFDNPAERLIDNDYIYVNETTIKVSGISDDLLNCLLAEPGAENYKQMHLLTVGTDITTSLLDIRNKLSSHNHDGSFGEEKIHIKNIEGIYEYRSIFNSRVYYPTKLQGHIATQYLHRDGYRYNSDPQNADNAILGDLLLKGNSDNSSFKLFFGEEVPFLQSFSTGQALLPGYLLLTSNLKFSWIGLSSNFLQSETDISFNIQGSENSHVSIISNRDLNIASKDKIVSIIKNVNTLSESGKILDSSYEWPSIRFESSAQIQKEDLNANINQNQIWLYNDNNAMILNNKKDGDPEIALISENKDLEYNNDRDQFNNYTGLNSIIFKTEFQTSEESRPTSEMISFTQGNNISLFQKKEEYLSDKKEDASKDYFKKEIPSYKKEYKKTPFYSFEEQNGNTENTNIIEINNSTEKKEGCFVYVIQHLVDDRSNPNFKYFYYGPGPNNPEEISSIQLRSMIDKKHIFNKTYDLVRQEKILNKQSIYSTFTNMNPINSYWSDENVYKRLSGDPLFVDPVNGKLRYYLKNEETQAEDEGYLELVATNNEGGSNHYNSPLEITGIVYRDNYILQRWYKHNPFPCSREYVNQHFYIYAFREYSSERKIYRFTEEFPDNHPYLESGFDYYKSFIKSRVLTKIVWKKFWLKENINSSSFDFEELSLSGSEKYNNEKYILVNQGYLIDCAISQNDSHSTENYNWDVSTDTLKEFARSSNSTRVCEFYEVNKDSDFYSVYPNWIAGKSFDPIVSFNSTVHNNQAINATIEGGLPFTRHGNLQTENDYQSFFNYFKKHEFEDDNVILYFGKGFVNFNEMVDGSDYPGNTKYDIVLDNYWSYNAITNINRSLKIKLKESTGNSRNYKSKQNVKIVFSDFNGENLNLINHILPSGDKLHNSVIYSSQGSYGFASSVIQYLWETVASKYPEPTDPSVYEKIFQEGIDNKFYNYFLWQRVFYFNNLILNEKIDNFEYYNEIKKYEFLDSNSVGKSFFINFPFGDNPFWWKLSDFDSAIKPRTFFNFINIQFEKNEETVFDSRRLNNQINLKTNGATDSFVNSKNLILKLAATRKFSLSTENVLSSNLDYNFNLGPIQGFYDIEIDRFINNERSHWSIASKLLLNEKFGCSLFNIKVNTDLNYCFVC